MLLDCNKIIINYFFLNPNFLTANPIATTNNVNMPPSIGVPGGGGGVLFGGVCANMILAVNKTATTNIILKTFLFIFYNLFANITILL